jgi:hypothetical protein
MKKIKKCPAGHFYDSKLEECPYCNGRTLDDDLASLIKKKIRFPKDMAMCYRVGNHNI